MCITVPVPYRHPELSGRNHLELAKATLTRRSITQQPWYELVLLYVVEYIILLSSTRVVCILD